VPSENRAKALSDFYFAADTRACAVSSSDEDEEMEQMDMQELEQDVLKGVDKAEIEMERKILDDIQMQNMHEGDERTEIEMQRKILEDIQMQKHVLERLVSERLGESFDWGAGLGLE
jgi:hypothetical protein